MAINGPRVQMPPTLSDMFATDAEGRIVGWNPAYGQFFHALQTVAFNASRSGPTSSRPSASTDGRYVGMPYFDTTLGLPVFLKTASTNIWVKADGTPA